ncbi:unnamed protein product, partial [Choristocarpus tenellus]
IGQDTKIKTKDIRSTDKSNKDRTFGTMNAQEVIARPLDMIRNVELGSSADEEVDGDGSDPVQRAFDELLCQAFPTGEVVLERVPVLSKQALLTGVLSANSLVRYRGMIQDMYDPEYFVGSYDEVESATGRRTRFISKYTESLATRPGFVNDYEGPEVKTMERLPLFCVPVPGLSPWAVPPPGRSVEVVSTENGAVSNKRARDSDDYRMDYTINESGDSDPCIPTPTPSYHRHNKIICLSPESVQTPSNDPGIEGEDSQRGGVGGVRGTDTVSTNFHQELELEDLACLVKMYGLKEGELKLNDTVDFVGVLVYDQALPPQMLGGVCHSHSSGTGGQDVVSGGSAGHNELEKKILANRFEGLEDFSRQVPPASLAPRLHCV